MTECALGKICRYRTENASTDQLPYLSTESMQPNKMGVIPSEAAPSVGKARLFRKGDTLISNIRPYFKKIWQAEYDGCCSADVLVFEPHSCDSDYLYWLLSDEAFFAYMVASSKGTKMPRGDKDAIMRYKVRRQSATEQRRLAAALNPIRELIRISQRTNDYLATIAEGVFEDWLLTAEGEPTPLSRFASFNPSTYSPKEKWPVVAYVDTGSVTRNHFDKPMVIDTATEKLPSRARRKVEDGDVIYSTVRPNQLHYGLVCNPPSNMLVSTGFTVARDSVGVGGPFIYLALTRPSITAKLQSVAEQSTSAYPSIKSSDLEQLEIPMPTKDEIEEIKPQLDSLFAAIAHNEYESKMLEELRDTLLSKLMSGEIDVSQIELPMQPNNHLSAG